MNSTPRIWPVIAALLTLGGCVTLGPTPALPEQPAVVTPKLPACAGIPQRKILITAFPLRYPEQIKSGQFMGWAQVTTTELKRSLDRGKLIQAVADANLFPFEVPDKAPEIERRDGVSLASEWAAKAGAQYVVAGVFHDFGAARYAEGQVRLETFVYDGHNGELVARKEFIRTLPMAVFGGPRSIEPGTKNFDTSGLGAAFNGLIDEIARWAEDTISCLPFAVSVSRVEDRRITIDMGSEKGIAVGMTLQSWRPGSTPPAKQPGAPVSSRQLPTAVIKEVQARTSVAEIPQQRFPPALKAGDRLYIGDPTARNSK